MSERNIFNEINEGLDAMEKERLSTKRNDLGIAALDWYDDQLGNNERCVTRDNFHMFALGLIDDLLGMKGRSWTSVGEMLPMTECLAVYVTPGGKKRIIRAKYAHKFKIEAGGDDDCETEYNEDDDTFYLKEGWLECIDNWGEYSSCYVVEGVVTQWMPLPDLPA